MKFVLAKSVFLALIGALIAACGQQSKQPQQQSVLVTAANETAAITRMRAIAQAEAQYQAVSEGEYGSLDQLIAKRYVNDPSSGKLTGYRFEVRVKPAHFEITAVPEKFGVSGTRSFYVDETNVIHAADKKGAPATASDPEV
jgi:hypothetical protein